MQNINNHRSNSEKKPKFESIESDLILVEPRHCLEFICTTFQISAALRITVEEFADHDSTFDFDIKSSKKEDYDVSEAKGQLKGNENKVIYFYLKKSASINKNLKDKFLLTIREVKDGCEPIIIYCNKFCMLIESRLNPSSSIKASPFSVNKNININSTVAKFLSMHGPKSGSPTSSILAESTQYKSMTKNGNLNKSKENEYVGLELMYKAFEVSSNNQLGNAPLFKIPHEIEQSISISKNNSFSLTEENLNLINKHIEGLKSEVSKGLLSIEKRKRKILALENQIKSNKARTRFRLYLSFIMILVALFLGFATKRIVLSKNEDESTSQFQVKGPEKQREINFTHENGENVNKEPVGKLEFSLEKENRLEN